MDEAGIESQKNAGLCRHGNFPGRCQACSRRQEEMFELLLSPDEEYEESKKRRGNEVIRFGQPGEEVIVHGTEHKFSMAPIAKMAELFEKERPDLLIVEGTAKVDIDPAMSGEDILKNHGEQQYMRWLARQRGIEVKSWDVPWADRFRDALKKHGRDQILGWTIAYAAKLLIDKNNGAPATTEQVKAAVRLALDRDTVAALKKEFPDTELDPDALDLDEIIKKFSNGKAIAELDAQTAEDLGTPWHRGGTNDVIRDMIALRDRNAIATIDDARQTHSKVFVVAGNDHAITWEKALKKMSEE